MTSPNEMTQREQQLAYSLARCGIEVVRGEKVDGKILDTVTGELPGFKFVYLWHYWTVEGNVPLSVAQELYDDPVSSDIRVIGHAGAPAPDDWVKYIDEEGRILHKVEDAEHMSMKERADMRFVADPQSEGKPVIPWYHIDTETGLRVFVDALKRHGVV